MRQKKAIVRPSVILIGVLLAAASACGGPAESLAAALADVKNLSPDAQQHTLYLTLYAIPEKDRDTTLRVLDYHVNGLSREAELVRPARVGKDLLRIDIRDYGWKKETVNGLAALDPYFHVKLVTEVDEYEDWGIPDGRGGYSRTWKQATGRKVKQVNAAAAAPWLDTRQISELIALTQSKTPLLRADWFFAQTARQVDRKGNDKTGYYQFLGVKNQKDAEELAGLDRTKARKIQREIAAIIAESGVALNNRQVFRFGTLAGSWWETRDVETSEDRKNALRQLDDDFGPPDALEVYFTLPNRLFGLLALNAKGELQATVPDKIAADDRTTSRDHRIHPALSCVRCHSEGLRPLDDYARAFYSNPPGDAKLSSPDYEKLKRLRQLYLGPLDEYYQDDQAVYARTLLRLTGFKPNELARAYAAVWQRYADQQVSGGQFAAELGVSQEKMTEAFWRYKGQEDLAAGKLKGYLDNILLGYLKDPEFKARREHLEESYVLGQLAIRGVKP